MNTVDTNTTAVATTPSQISLVPPPTPEEVKAAELKLAQEAAEAKSKAIARFDTTTGFRLEAEIIGRSVKKTVSKSGAVKVALAAKKELAVISGLTGADLDAWTRMRKDELKAKQSEMAARMSGDNNWTGGEIVLSAKGDAVTMKWKKAAPITVGLRAEPTNAELAQTLGITEAEVVAMKARKVEAMEAAAKAEADAKAKAIQDEKDAQELAALEAQEIANSAKGNGAVHAE